MRLADRQSESSKYTFKLITGRYNQGGSNDRSRNCICDWNTTDHFGLAHVHATDPKTKKRPPLTPTDKKRFRDMFMWTIGVSVAAYFLPKMF